MSIEESITTILGQIKEGKLSEVPALLSQIQGEPLNSPQLGTEQSDPENVALRALIHAQRGDLDQAFELLLPVVQKQPKTPYLQWALQWLDRPEAKNAIKQERFYGFIAYLINQFATLNRDKQSRECTLEPMPTLIAKLRETQPPDADLLVVSVSLLRRLGFVDQALEYANLAYEMEPSFRSATARAVAYESLKKPDEALEAYRDAMKLEPNEVSIRLSMGDLLWEYGRRDEAEEMYQDALSLEPRQPWALPSSLYLRWLRTREEGVRFQLLDLAEKSPDNHRAQQLAEDATPYFGYLPTPSDSLTNLARKLQEEEAEIQSITMTTIEAPSNYLASPLLQNVTPTVSEIPEPDPRKPQKPVKYCLWEYDDAKPRVAIDPPDPAIAEKVLTLAKQRFFLLDWSEEALDIAEDLEPENARDLLATMVHPPGVAEAEQPWSHVVHVQMAAALILAKLEFEWEGSQRRDALLSLVWGPCDWTIDAALTAMAIIALEEDDPVDEITSVFRELRQSLPEDRHVCYRDALLWNSLRLPSLSKEEINGVRDSLYLSSTGDPEELAQSLYETAEMQEDDEDFDGAIESLTKAITLKPDFAKAYQLRGSLLLESDEPSAALEDFNAVLKYTHGSGFLFASRGEALRLLGRYSEAIADFDESIRRDSSVYLPYLWRGFAHQSAGNRPGAAADFTRVVCLEPERVTGYFHRGSCRRKMDRLPEAIHDLSKCLELDPEYLPALSERGIAYGLMEDRPNAIQDFTRLLEQHESGYIFNLRAMQHYFSKKYGEAIHDHAEACRLDPDDESACNGLAWILATCPVAEHRDGPRAVEMARHACELTEWEDSGYIDTLAAAHAESGNFEEALNMIEKVLELVDESQQGEYLQRQQLYREGRAYHTE